MPTVSYNSVNEFTDINNIIIGDDFNIDLTFPFDLTGYVMSAQSTIYNGAEVNIPIVSGSFTTSSSSITLTVSDSITKLLNQKKENFSMWALRLTLADFTRTYIHGRLFTNE